MGSDMSETREITSPYKFPLLGHTPYLLGAFPSGKIGAIGRERDGLWRVCLPNSSFIAVTCFRILDELCDESRFEKRIHGGQVEIRKVVQKGLFTANTDDQEWGRAHRILMPGFGSKAMGTYLPVMNSVALDLVESWHGRVGSPIDVNRDMTMASLEVIGVCGFDYHFADFSNYREIRPWGYFENLIEERNYKVKKLVIFPKEKLSLQVHNFRKENWYVVKGSGKVFINNKVFSCKKGSTFEILKKQKHSIENTAKSKLEIIEIQYGSKLSEEDIIRFRDKYGRI